jgi:hypothetical protein
LDNISVYASGDGELGSVGVAAVNEENSGERQFIYRESTEMSFRP